MAKREKVDGIPTIGMPCVNRLTLVRGAAGCGKTRRLVEEVRSLVSQGADPSGVLVVCASPDAARAFEGRLGAGAETGGGAGGVRVACARQLAIELLAQPDAAALFGHGPRVLLPFEEDVLFEDLKTSGVEPERIEGMFAFFKRSMTEISDDHPDFLMDDDEVAVMGRLRDGLRLRGAYLEEQLSANAARYLKLMIGAGDARGAGRYAHVFVDDGQYLSRASQVMAGLLAGETLCVATDPAAFGRRVYESYPYAAGIGELLEANPQATVVELRAFGGAGRVGRAVNAVRREAGLAPCAFSDESAQEGTVAVQVLPDADQEIERAVGVVVDALAGGLAPDDVYVVSTNGARSADIARALSEKGVGCAVACDWGGLATSGADDSEDAGYLKVLTAVLLAGDPCDDAAWRSWCAFDDPLCASGEVAAVMEADQADGLRPHLCLHEVLASPDCAASAGSLVDAYRAGSALLERVKGMGREELFRTLTDELCGPGAPVPSPLLCLCSGTAPTDGAATLRSRILQRLAVAQGWEREPAEEVACGAGGDASASGEPGGASGGDVRIGGMERLGGLTPRLVVFSGFVNGLYPEHGFFDETVTPPGDVEKVKAARAQTLSCAIAKARDAAVFTAFREIPCAQAERLGLKIDRIGLKRHVRMARVSPSIFCAAVDEAGDARAS